VSTGDCSVSPQLTTVHIRRGLIESLEGVARAYVHADYSSENP
jgi:hypothetical protein